MTYPKRKKRCNLPMKAIGYVRCRIKDQTEKLSWQYEDVLTRSMELDTPLLGIFSDVCPGYMSDQRPGLHAMIACCARPDVSLVITPHPDRMFRDSLNEAWHLYNNVSRLGCAVTFTRSPGRKTGIDPTAIIEPGTPYWSVLRALKVSAEELSGMMAAQDVPLSEDFDVPAILEDCRRSLSSK